MRRPENAGTRLKVAEHHTARKLLVSALKCGYMCLRCVFLTTGGTASVDRMQQSRLSGPCFLKPDICSLQHPALLVSRPAEVTEGSLLRVRAWLLALPVL